MANINIYQTNYNSLHKATLQLVRFAATSWPLVRPVSGLWDTACDISVHLYLELGYKVIS
jgi:hypothetical protein